MTGIRKSTNASPSRGALPDVESNVHDLFSVRNMFYSQIDPVFVDRSPIWSQSGQSRANWTNRQKRQKTNASPRGEAQVMGGFPKRSEHIYTEFTRPIQPPPLIISSHGRVTRG